MKIIVDVKNYTKWDYDEYYDGGTPENNPYVLGQVVAIKEKDENFNYTGKEQLGVVLGVITKNEVRTDAEGMVGIDDIRPAVVTDFGKSNVSYIQTLYDECQGLPVQTFEERTS